jgi:hypothetical protein
VVKKKNQTYFWRLKVKRLEKIISMYENKVFGVLYEKILYCSTCKDIILKNYHLIRCSSSLNCKNNVCKNCLKNKLSWKCDECKF